MRFVHTADWQIGMKAAHVGAVGHRVREVRLATALAVMEEAAKREADFVILAGDTFEDNGVDRVLVQRVADTLTVYPGPVFILPGNHDPLVPGSLWDHPVWAEQARVHVLREAAPVQVPGGVLWPCPVLEKYAATDPTAWIHRTDPDRIQIGVAHGTVEGVPDEELAHPIPRDAAERAGLDYLALGHWHSTSLYTDGKRRVRQAYAGTHEPTRFGERDSGQVLLVEIEGPGAGPKVTALATGRLTWRSEEADLRAPGDLARMRERIQGLQDPEETLLKVRLSGLLPGQDRAELLRLEEIVASRFLYGRVDTDRLYPSPTDQTWVEALPRGVVREAAARLQGWSDPAFTGTRPDGVSAERAAAALLELYALTQETGS